MTQLVVKNEGGPGRFCFMPSAVWPTTNFKVIRQHPKIQMLNPLQSNEISVKFDAVIPFEPWHEISNNLVCVTSKSSDQPAHTCRLIRAFSGRLNFYDCLATDQTSFELS